MSYVAWGASKLLELYITRKDDHGVVACIDSFSRRSEILGVPVVTPEEVNFEYLGDNIVVIFATSSESVQNIFSLLSQKGLKYGTNFILYSTLFFPEFARKLDLYLDLQIPEITCKRYESFVLNSIKPHHTTVLGTVLLDEVINQIQEASIPGAIMEVGSFEGGNALALMIVNRNVNNRRYYVMDSFEGFPEVSDLDPKKFGVGTYATKTSYEQIVNEFAVFENSEVIKGFVPDSFSRLPSDVLFSLVFYDCDLYQPALDTFKFAWSRLALGGYMVVHDYCSEEGGFKGVKIAVDEFFGKLPVNLVEFPENTMAVIRKLSN